MPDFIVDNCVDLNPAHENYPSYFFDDLKNDKRFRIVLGGTRVKAELKGKEDFLTLLNNLKINGQVVTVLDSLVDEAEENLEYKIRDVIGDVPRECDDLHIFALAKVSNCEKVISRDHRMATCRNRIRQGVGHDACPDLKVISSESTYRDHRWR